MFSNFAVVIVNGILVCEYATECNVVPPGVRKLNNQVVDFVYQSINQSVIILSVAQIVLLLRPRGRVRRNYRM